MSAQPQPSNDPRRGQEPQVQSPTNPVAGVSAADRLTVLAHDLSGMIDGSMRWLTLASQALPADEAGADAEKIERARGQIESVRETLGRMAGMVTAAMKSKNVPLGSPLLAAGESVSLGEAIDHAVDVIRPIAHEQKIAIDVRIEKAAGIAHAGAMYSVILNAMTNAAESIARCAEDEGPVGGRIEVSAGIGRDASGERRLMVEVVDDGHGLPEGSGADWAFRHGYTSKSDGCGLGLAIAQQIVAEAGGRVTLEARSTHANPERPGAVFRVSLPMPKARAVGEDS